MDSSPFDQPVLPMPLDRDRSAERPLVTVVTPTKNRLALLLETMDSVAAQSCHDWEHIVVDDGSDDGTAEEMARRAALDPRVRYVARTGPISGANACRNLGTRLSRSDLIVFLDSDDLLEPHSLGKRVVAMQRNLDADFVTFLAGVFVTRPGDLDRDFDAELIGDDLMRFLQFECPWQTSAPVWRKAALERLGGFDETLPSWQDIDLHVRAITAGCRYLRFADVDHHIRWQFEAAKVSVEQRRSPQHLDAAIRTIEKFERSVREGPGMTWVRRRALCSLYFFVAEQRIRVDGLGQALRAWRRIRERDLGPLVLHLTGVAMLLMIALKLPGTERLVNKWKGWMRLRTNPELLPA